MNDRVYPSTNTTKARAIRRALCWLFATRDPVVATVCPDRYPEAHDTLRRILSGQRVSDYEVEWAHGVVEGIRRTQDGGPA